MNIQPWFQTRISWAIAVFLGLFLLAPVQTRAQELGVLAGLNYGAVEDVEFGDAQTTYEQRSGYHIGLYLDLDMGPLALRPGIRYIEAGALFDGLSETLQEESERSAAEGLDEFDVSMIVVPIDVRLDLPLPLIQPYAFAGPELRFARASDTGSQLAQNVRKREMAGNFGVGAQVKIPGLGLTLSPEARYTFGLTGLMGETVNVGGRSFDTGGRQNVNLFFLSLGLEF